METESREWSSTITTGVVLHIVDGISNQDHDGHQTSFVLIISCMIVVCTNEYIICPNGGSIMRTCEPLQAGMFHFYQEEKTCVASEIMIESDKLNATERDEVQQTNESKYVTVKCQVLLMLSRVKFRYRGMAAYGKELQV